VSFQELQAITMDQLWPIGPQVSGLQLYQHECVMQMGSHEVVSFFTSNVRIKNQLLINSCSEPLASPVKDEFILSPWGTASGKKRIFFLKRMPLIVW
jgi:hypothetical protein